MPTHTLKTTSEHRGLRLDVFLAQNLPDVPSRTFVKKLMDAGHVKVNQAAVKAHSRLAEGQEIVVFIPEEFLLPQDINPENIPLDIFYEDDEFLIINKPSGMLVHPSAGSATGTLVNALLFHCRHLSDANIPAPEAAEEGEVHPQNFRPGIVHRLDKETSGLLVVAKTNQTHVHLANQFAAHTVRKQYLALVEGEIEFEEGKVDAPLGRHPLHHDKRTVAFDDMAKEAVTFYRVVKRVSKATLVQLFPRTGRTHQLRVHMAYFKHPILGDNKYGKRGTFPRLALHAQSLGFIHPRTEQYVEFSSRSPREFLERAGIVCAG